MEVSEANEVFADHEGNLIFDHTKIILRRKEDGQYFYSRTQKRIGSDPSRVNVDELTEMHEIPTNEVWPVFNPESATQAPTPLPPNTHVKRPSLITCGHSPTDFNRFREQVSAEVEMCEVLLKHPHPSIAEYRGCVVEGGRITGLCFAKYHMTLSEMKRKGDSMPFDKENLLEGIEDGVRHLHKLGLVHNDLNPSNIMVDGDGNPVIIDFDSCRRLGHELGLKEGTPGWALEEMTHARHENDLYGISKIREFLMKT